MNFVKFDICEFATNGWKSYDGYVDVSQIYAFAWHTDGIVTLFFKSGKHVHALGTVSYVAQKLGIPNEPT